MGKPSKQELDTIFGTHKDEEVVTIILTKGELKAGEGFGKELSGLNASRYVTALNLRCVRSLRSSSFFLNV